MLLAINFFKRSRCTYANAFFSTDNSYAFKRGCTNTYHILANTYRFTADVYDVSEMIPWIRTFICRIIDMNFTSKTLENQFKSDLDTMYRMYGIEEVSK